MPYKSTVCMFYLSVPLSYSDIVVGINSVNEAWSQRMKLLISLTGAHVSPC